MLIFHGIFLFFLGWVGILIYKYLVSRNEFYTYIHLNYLRLEFYIRVTKKKFIIYFIIFKNIILFFIFFLLDITWWEAFGSWNLIVLWRHLHWQTTIMTNFFKINFRIQSYKLLLTYFQFGSSCILIPLFFLLKFQ